MLKKLKGYKFTILSLIIAIIFLLGIRTKNKLANDLNDSILFTHHLFSYVDSLERRYTALANSFDSLKEETCNRLIEDSTDRFEIAKGYDCLATIELNKNDLASTYRAIRYESLALEASYSELYQKKLLSILTPSYPADISQEFDEYSFLTTLSKSKDIEVVSKALYRMSLIHSIGRASSLKNYNYDLIKAATLKTQVLKLIDFNKRKSIDILFSLNNSQEYINYARTTISSILLNADLDSDYNFYFIMDNQDPISLANQNKLNDLHNIGPYQTKFITLPKNMLDTKESFNDLLVRLIFQRFLVEDVLANLDSIITLDLDILVLRDLYKLQNQENFDQKILAGSLDYMTINRKELCDFRYTYINSGVTVQNLGLMRKLKSSAYLIDEYQNKNSKNEQCFIMPEQDTLNMAYKDQIKPISRRWNKLTEFNYNIDYLPFILHFAGKKPSTTNQTPEHQLYMKYKELSNYK